MFETNAPSFPPVQVKAKLEALTPKESFWSNIFSEAEKQKQNKNQKHRDTGKNGEERKRTCF